MEKERFEGKTLEEAKKKLAKWQSTHKKAIIKLEYPPVSVKMQSGRFSPKSAGSVSSVYINIDYENSN